MSQFGLDACSRGSPGGPLGAATLAVIVLEVGLAVIGALVWRAGRL